jgi:MtN3 and saliva related transmembrane protein
MRSAQKRVESISAKGAAKMSDHWSNKVKFGVIALSVIAFQGCQGLGIHDTTSLLSPRLQRSEVVGFVAGLGTTFAALPDLLAMLKRRSSAGMNPRMAAIMCAFQFAWVYYGLLIASRPVILWNVVAIVINGLSVGAFLHFSRGERSQAKKQ